MSNIVAADDYKKIEALVLQGDLSKLSPAEKVVHYNKVCESVGLNPLTRPFDYMRFQGKEILYARKDATDQLRKLHGISVRVVDKQTDGDLFLVTAQATAKDGRVDEDMGALSVKGLSGEALANAKMKAITKAKRRVTLAICGLGFLDETEVEAIQREVKEDGAKQLTTFVQETAETPEFEAADYFEQPEEPAVESSLEEFVFQVGQKNKGKKLKDIPTKDLGAFVAWVDSQDPKNISEEMKIHHTAVVEYLIDREGSKGEA